ncbi:DUF378 domain-containing protein [Caballeronia sp. LZ043]|uniref:DUF378 domain-containing protein n=1 Tax=Caballeronia sp. LZ043 TaxID=3038569 RepID=UPI002854EA61|nr:DUF378 domain-containing protein [Caballeronia sp. LZ043]MDR5826141.1 DUF378 domain-containing protein [Caballeronia sp. LZ043]
MATITSKGTVVVRRSPIDWVVGALVIISALSWGLVGLAQIDLVAAVLGNGSIPARAVYALVGVAGIYMLVSAFLWRDQRLASR